jgi:hypothetical protein
MIKGVLYWASLLVLGTAGCGLIDYLVEGGDKQKLERMKATCRYEEHPIETLMWEVYRNGEAPLGSVLYFVGYMRSENVQAVPCLREALPERWK